MPLFYWTKPEEGNSGFIQTNLKTGGKIISGKKTPSGNSSSQERSNTLMDLMPLFSHLPNNLQEYALECLREHKDTIEAILLL
jgi:hypothetical protein